MKFNAKILMPFALLLVGLFACEEKQELQTDDTQIAAIISADNIEEIALEDLPVLSKEYIYFNYFDTYVESVERVVNRGFRTTLGNGEILFFNTDGGVLEFEGEIRPNGPLGGVHPHGPCMKLRRWLRGHNGNHDCNGDGRPDGPFAFNIDELPAAITDYVTENYPDNDIVRAAFKDDRFLILVNAPVVLAFDGEGNFLREINPLAHCARPCHRLEADELSESITTYIGDNFPDSVVRRACERPRGTIVFLANGDEMLILGFNPDGEFVFQRP